jgi:hypothetical protein
VRQIRNKAGADRVCGQRKYDRDRPRLPVECCGRLSPFCEDHIWLQINQFFRHKAHAVNIASGPTNVDP